MVPAAIVDAIIDELVPHLETGRRRSSTAATPTTTTTSRARSALQPKGIHYVDMGTSGGVWGLERGYCLMIGGETDVVKRLDPIFTTLAPGRGDIPRTPGREKLGGTAEHGYLHCGPAGAGHFVKMVHNGIEYGLMAAYAEGLNILKNADIGKAHAREGRRDDAAAQPRALPVRLQPRRHHRGVAARQRRQPPGCSTSPRRRWRQRPELEKFGGKVADSGEGRWTVAAANDEGVPAFVLTAVALRAVRVARARMCSRTRCCPPCASVSAATSRKSGAWTRQRSDALVFFGASGDLATRRSFPRSRRWRGAANWTSWSSASPSRRGRSISWWSGTRLRD